jgi:hypothetical protein
VVVGVDDAEMLVQVFNHFVEFSHLLIQLVEALPLGVRQALDGAV